MGYGEAGISPAVLDIYVVSLRIWWGCKGE